MPSIVLELQHDALNPAVAVSDLLRKALLIATKLDVPVFKAWIENELDGYRDSGSAPPPYRISSGTVMGQDEWGRWVPVIFTDPENAKTVAKVIFFDAIAEIEALIHRTSGDKGGKLSLNFSPELEEVLRRNSHEDLVRHTRVIRAEDLRRIIDAVRTEILKWSLKLEKDGILGEGMTFSTGEQRKASEVHYTTHFHGAVGNVAQNSQHVNQTASIATRTEDLERLVTDFSYHIDELSLDVRQRQRAEAQLAILSAELSGEPDTEIVGQAGRTLRNITEGAVGSLLATAAQPSVWHWIHQVLASF